MKRQMRSFNRVVLGTGLALLVFAMVCCVCARCIQNNQTMLQALVGGVADASGATTLSIGVTSRDLATQRHQGLSDAQQRPLVVVGGVWFLAVLVYLCLCVRAGLMAYGERYDPSEKPEEIQNTKKHKPSALGNTKASPTAPTPAKRRPRP